MVDIPLDNAIPVSVPHPKRLLLARAVTGLRGVPGVVAVVLGGSYARGTQRPESDLDVGIYYREQAPFAIDEIRRVVEALSNRPDLVVTDLYEWGRWVNGGAWIHTDAGKVDFLYRNLDQVERTITNAEAGIAEHDYEQQPAFGFYSVAYLAETACCIPLYDPGTVLTPLKQRVADYPPKLQQRLVADSLWSAEFTLIHARDFAAAGDVYNTAGCLTRMAASLNQALFALNEAYFQSDKKVMAIVEEFCIAPPGYAQNVAAILASIGATPVELQHSVEAMAAVWHSVAALAGDRYRPKFVL